MPGQQFYLSLNGRISRRDWWLRWYLPGVILCTAVVVLTPRQEFGWSMQVLWLLVIWPFIAVCAKRCHDRGRSAWFLLLTLVPIIGYLWMVVDLGFLGGDEGANRFGDAPT